jgi:hypothetical protein
MQETSAAACRVMTREDKPEQSVPVCITAVSGRVHICSPALEAECDRMIEAAQDRVMLEGNVQVEFRTAERPGAIFADRIALGLQDATYEVNCQPVCCVPLTLKDKPGAEDCDSDTTPCEHQQSCPVVPRNCP